MSTTTTTEYEDAEIPEEVGANQSLTKRFDGIQLAGEGPATQALIAKVTADIQARWVMALKRPRDVRAVRVGLLAECKRPGFAKKAFFTVPRGGKDIQGLTIRFAEAAASMMGNLGIETVTIFESDTSRTVQVAVTDYETNLIYSTQIEVKKEVERKQLKRGQRALRERVNSFGERVFVVEATDDDIAVKQGALVSKAMRTQILRILPAALKDECFELARQIARDENAKDPETNKNRAIDGFATVGVKPRDMEAWLGKPLDQATRDDWADLSELLGALREREITWEEAMERPHTPRKADPAAQTQAAPAASSAAPAAAASSTQAAPAATTPAAAKPAERASSSGKGTQALKDKMRDEQKPGASTPATDAPPADSGGAIELVERPCAGCGVPIEVPKDSPKGQQCTACRNA